MGVLGIFSACKFHHYQTNEGELISNYKIREYPSRSTNYTKWQKKIVFDADSNYVISKSRSKVKGGCFHFEVVRERTISFSKEGKRVCKELVKKDVIVKTKSY
jgi:hypothetical protein